VAVDTCLGTSCSLGPCPSPVLRDSDASGPLQSWRPACSQWPLGEALEETGLEKWRAPPQDVAVVPACSQPLSRATDLSDGDTCLYRVPDGLQNLLGFTPESHVFIFTILSNRSGDPGPKGSAPGPQLTAFATPWDPGPTAHSHSDVLGHPHGQMLLCAMKDGG
jgi:hypothetical protein